MRPGDLVGVSRWTSLIALARGGVSTTGNLLFLALILAACLEFPFGASVHAQAVQTAQAPSTQQPVQLPADMKPLELDQPVERELKGDDVQRYEIHLAAGEFLHVSTTQKGIHLLVALFRANGEMLIQAERPNGDFGLVPLSAVVDAQGIYVLSVEAGPDTAASGHYEIRITAERAPTAEDLKRLEAERVFLDGLNQSNSADPQTMQKIIGQWEPILPIWRSLHDDNEEALMEGALGVLYGKSGSIDKAIDYENQALKIWRALGDRNGEAFTLNFIGYFYSETPDKQKAIDSYLLALPLQQATGDTRGQIVTLNSLGNLYHGAGNKQKAFEAYQQDLVLAHDLDDHLAEATALKEIGFVVKESGNDKLALESFEEAVQFWRDAKDDASAAGLLESMSLLHSRLGQRQKAVDDLVEAVSLWHEAGDTHSEGKSLVGLGSLYDDIGDRQNALEAFNKALPLLHSSGNRNDEAVALNDIGLVYAAIGEGQKALDYYNQALSLPGASDENSGQTGITLGNIATVLSSLGEKQKALEYLNRALALVRKAGLRDQEGSTLQNLAALDVTIGDMQGALDNYKQALELERATGDQRAEATTLSNLGNLAFELGEKQKALDYFNQALPLERSTDDKNQEATTLNNIGYAYVHMNQGDQAVDAYTQALALLVAVGDRAGEASTLNNIGTLYETLGEPEVALSNYEKALNIARDVGDRSEEAGSLARIGNVAYKLHQADRALDSLNQAIAIAVEIRNPLLQSEILDDLKEYWSAQDRPEVAVFFGKQEIDRIQEIRMNIRGLQETTQQSFLKSNEEAYREVADLLMSLGRLPEAEQVLGLLKNEEYFEFIRRDGSDASSLTAPVTLTKPEADANAKYGELSASVTAIGSEWAALRAKPSRTPEEDAHLAELSGKLKQANAQWSQFLDGLYAELGKAKPAQDIVGQIQENTNGMQDVLRHLDPGTVALYTLVGEDKYRVIVVTPTVMQAREYPIRAADLRKKVLAFRQALDQPQSDPIPLAQELYRILVGPVERDLEGANAKTLMWSLDDVLRYLPVAALHDGKDYLVAKYRNEVFTPASLSHLTERPDVESWRGLAMGVSQAYGNFPALPSVSGELNRVVRDPHADNKDGVMPGEVMLNAAFTEDAMKKALADGYPLIHIASHFAFQPGNETDSFLLLGGTNADGTHLTLAEIRKDPELTFTDTQLLTLSACDTAMGGASGDGREVDGLGTLAQQKGAKAVVASLWEVNDASTGFLMQEFYRLWITNAGMPKAEALREAQIALLHGEIKRSGTATGSNATAANDGTNSAAQRGLQPEGSALPKSYTHPYYWAPFVLIGNWR